MNRPPELRITLDGLIVDCFAGGGGASTGIEMACGRSPDIAINHDPQAVAMHKLNHPNTKHYCENIVELAPRKVTRGRHVALAWFSPDCTFHSKARGGKPFRDRNKARRTRGLAWVVTNWAREVRPDVIMLENVEEFADWGPLGPDGKPCPLRKGFTFRRWCSMLQKLGYEIDMRELRACDYGAPTTRKRLFIIARCDGKPIVWPEPTHAKGGARGLLPYRTAAECIDFSLPCPSIFLTKEEGAKVGAKRPLAENTMRRIARGLKKFVLDNPKPFIVGLAHGDHARGAGDRSHGLDEPVRTIHAGGNNHALITPAVMKFRGESPGTAADAPLDTITAGPKDRPAGNAHGMGLLAPIVARIGQTGGNGDYSNDAREPLTTITTKAEHLLVAPIGVPRYGERHGQEPRAASLEHPAPTVVPTQNGQQIVAAFLARHFGGNYEGAGAQAELPIPTITARDHHAVVTAHVAMHTTGHPGAAADDPAPTITTAGQGAVVASSLLKMKGTGAGAEIEAPLHTIQAQGFHHAEVRAFLSRYNGSSIGHGLDVPMSTIDTTDRLGLVMVEGVPHAIVDIGMRMLKPRELYLCQGFRSDYVIEFTYNGKPLPADAQVRMVGNSVSPVIPAALLRANFAAAEQERAA